MIYYKIIVTWYWDRNIFYMKESIPFLKPYFQSFRPPGSQSRAALVQISGVCRKASDL